MRNPIFFTFFIILALVLTACSSTSTPEAAPAANDLAISAETVPSPAGVGEVEIILNVKDALGNPVSGASVNIYADHIDMSGMDMSGQATEQGNGRYAITANFSMSGNWLLKVDVKTEDQTETQKIVLVIN